MAFTVTMPSLGMTMEEGTIVSWLKREGDRVAKGEPLFEVETDKVVMEVEAPETGVLLKIHRADGETVPVMQPIAIIGQPGETVEAPTRPVPTGKEEVQAAPPTEARTVVPAAAEERLKVSPRARRAAQEHGIDVAALVGKGTGPGGRIVERDVLALVEAQKAAAPPPPSPVLAPAPKPLRLTGLRRLVAQRVTESAFSAPHVTLFTTARMEEARRLRDQLIAETEARFGIRLSYNDLFIKAAAKALMEHPALNTSIGGQELVQHREAHIGLAVAVPDGLLVPVIRSAQAKSVFQICHERHRLVEAVRDGRITPDEVKGSTFSITNLGGYGIECFTPIINPPECAILGVGAIHEVPVVNEGQLGVGLTVALSLSFDHRIVDGAPAGAFLARIRELLERPYMLLVEE